VSRERGTPFKPRFVQQSPLFSHKPQKQCRKMLIPRIPQETLCRLRIHPMCAVSRFTWRAKPIDRARQHDMANFLGVLVIFRHVGKPSKHPKPLDRCDLPTGFFHHFAVQRRHRVLTGINSATRKLVFRLWCVLKGQQQLPPARQQRINTGPPSIVLPGFRYPTKSCNHHAAPLPCLPVAPICPRYAKPSSPRKAHDPRCANRVG